MHPLVTEYFQLRLEGYSELLAMDLAMWHVDKKLWENFYGDGKFHHQATRYFAQLLKAEGDCLAEANEWAEVVGG